MKLTWMVLRPLARGCVEGGGHTNIVIDLDLLTDSRMHTVLQSFRPVHSGSVCMAALNLPDVGLKLNLMWSSPETLSSTLVNY